MLLSRRVAWVQSRTAIPARPEGKSAGSGAISAEVMVHQHIVEARYVAGCRVWLRFRDGTEGEIDLSAELDGPVFAPLRSMEEFRRFRVSPEFHTLVWPTGADLAPEFLYRRIRIPA